MIDGATEWGQVDPGIELNRTGPDRGTYSCPFPLTTLRQRQYATQDLNYWLNMSVDLSKAVGYQLQDHPVAWTKKDLLLYAIGIGAKKDDLSFVYELGRYD